MRELIEHVLLPAFDNPMLAPLEDQARIPLAQLVANGDRLAFTTDTYVVSPVEFPGGDIGKLAVPEYILNKPGKPTASEWAKLTAHPSIGAAGPRSIRALACA